MYRINGRGKRDMKHGLRYGSACSRILTEKTASRLACKNYEVFPDLDKPTLATNSHLIGIREKT